MPLQIIANKLAAVIGLNADSLGSSAIENAVRSRLQVRQLTSLEDYAVLVSGDPAELSALIEELVVPETWFFREPDAFRQLATRAFATLRKEPGRVFRVLSAPCSTGEEPYSAAISLLEAGLLPRQFTVEAVDISASALAAATRGLYRMHSFRGTEPELRERHFNTSDAGFELMNEIRSLVGFRTANLADPLFFVGEGPYDAIFCRNVLIYLHETARQTALSSLHRLLAPSGVLFAGHAEALDTMSGHFRRAGAGFSFVKRGHSLPPPAVATERAGPAGGPKRSAPARAQPGPPPAVAARPAAAEAAKSSLVQASEYADRGDLDSAAKLCERHVAEQGPSADAYCLLGVVRNAQGQREAAEACFNKVLYLEPSRTEALLHMALICESKGDRAAAANFRRRAERNGPARGKP